MNIWRINISGINMWFFLIGINTSLLAQQSIEVFYASGNLKAEGKVNEAGKTGKWKFYYPEKQLNAIEHYKNGLLDGKLTYFFINEEVQAIEYWE